MLVLEGTPLLSSPADRLMLAQVRPLYLRAVQRACPEELALSAALLERISPPQWRLEWFLPRWLGDAFGLDPAIADRITLANVLGLGALRLWDDLHDGECAADAVAAGRLALALFDAAVAIYKPLLPGASPFWENLASRMREWRVATRQRPDPAGVGLLANDADAALARRAAPLHVCAAAICTLSERSAELPLVAKCLECALTAAVLYDDAQDWESDLAAGRWNAFVATLADPVQSPASRHINRPKVLSSLLLGTEVDDYFQRVETKARAGAGLSDGLGVEPLSAHLYEFARGVEAYACEVRDHYGGLLEQATDCLFGPAEGLA